MIIYFIKKYLESPKIENGFNVFSFIKQNEFESLTNIHIKIKKNRKNINCQNTLYE